MNLKYQVGQRVRILYDDRSALFGEIESVTVRRDEKKRISLAYIVRTDQGWMIGGLPETVLEVAR